MYRANGPTGTSSHRLGTLASAVLYLAVSAAIMGLVPHHALVGNTAALLPSVLMLWSYTTATGLTVFTDLVDLTVVTVAIPYLFSACAQLTYLVSRRRRVQGWALARDLTIAGAGVLFSMWVTFAAGYAAEYQALIVVLAGVIIYAFLKAQRERAGQVAAPVDSPPLEPSTGH